VVGQGTNVISKCGRVPVQHGVVGWAQRLFASATAFLCSTVWWAQVLQFSGGRVPGQHSVVGLGTEVRAAMFRHSTVRCVLVDCFLQVRSHGLVSACGPLCVSSHAHTPYSCA